jgi:ABC-type bacteriocin/lantibiotic exporter with double-glycine peptidase domain
LGNIHLDSLREQTGVAMSQQDIFRGTLLENITLGNENISLETIKELAGKTGLNDFIATLKDGYDTLLDPTGKRLPGNVVQRILLVRALANKPRLLLLEEPWMNFTNGHRNQIIQLLADIKNTTMVVVSNDEEFAKQCDRVIVMNENGTIKY